MLRSDMITLRKLRLNDKYVVGESHDAMTRGTQTWRRRGVLKSIGALGALAGAGVTGATPGRSPGPKPDELLVGAKQGVSTAEVESEISTATTASSHLRNYRPVLFSQQPGYIESIPATSNRQQRLSTCWFVQCSRCSRVFGGSRV